MVNDSFFHDEDGPGRDGEHILIRYADDFIVLSKKMDERVKGWIDNKMRELGLTLNSEKTSRIDIRSGAFEFLGFRFGYQRSL
ncbi:MAG: group II intron reverse transcriptase/maturase, partial [bacterium]